MNLDLNQSNHEYTYIIIHIGITIYIYPPVNIYLEMNLDLNQPNRRQRVA